jgi:hypothetical protein
MIELWTAPSHRQRKPAHKHPKPTQPEPAPDDAELAAWMRELRHGDRV